MFRCIDHGSVYLVFIRDEFSQVHRKTNEEETKQDYCSCIYTEFMENLLLKENLSFIFRLRLSDSITAIIAVFNMKNMIRKQVI